MVDEACCASQPGALQVVAVPICRSFTRGTLPIVLFPRSDTTSPEKKQRRWKLKAEAHNGYCNEAHTGIWCFLPPSLRPRQSPFSSLAKQRVM